MLLLKLILRASGDSFAVPASHFVYKLYAPYALTIAATLFELFLVLLIWRMTKIEISFLPGIDKNTTRIDE